jgi:hypothetical protein
LWGVSLDHVIQGIQEGSIASRNEHGFVFVRWGEHHEPQTATPAAPAVNNAIMAATTMPDAMAAAPTSTIIAPALTPVMSPQYAAEDGNPIVNSEEIAALGIHPAGDPSTNGAPEVSPEIAADEEPDSPQADQDYLNFLQHSGDWRRARRETAKLRQPPVAQPKAKAA